MVAVRALQPVAALACALLGCSDAGSAAVKAKGAITPANLKARLVAAHPGETLRLSPGDYGAVTFPRRVFSPALRIDAGAARFTGLTLDRVSGVSLTGGTLSGPGGRSYGIKIAAAKNIRIEGMTIGGAHRGIVIDRSSDIALVGNRLHGLISDGIDIALSRRVRVDGNSCRDFKPTLAVYAADGTRLQDGDHPDCIQGWSRPTAPPTADILVTNNVMDGSMQGVFFGNHVRGGVDDGGFDRILIRGNRIRVSHPSALVLDDARNSEVSRNHVSTIPGSVLLKNGRPIRAQLRVTGGSGNRVCGNIVGDFPNHPATNACP